MSTKPAFCSWDQVPLWCRIEDFARVRNVSVATIRREIRDKTCVPMPRAKSSATAAYTWSRAEIEQHWKVSEPVRTPGARRNLFSKAKARQLAHAS